MKRAFSMIELIFVIVVIGILASAIKMAMPDTRSYSDTDFILQKIDETRMRALLFDHTVLGDESWRGEDYNDTCITLTKDYLNTLEKDAKKKLMKIFLF
jgi:prepilin-type N-terminal cleavage/methylation domain-containing protein